jgi:hypothetical protein
MRIITHELSRVCVLCNLSDVGVSVQFVLMSQPNAADLREFLRQIYDTCYVEHVIKNPLYTPGEPFKCAPLSSHFGVPLSRAVIVCAQQSGSLGIVWGACELFLRGHARIQSGGVSMAMTGSISSLPLSLSWSALSFRASTWHLLRANRTRGIALAPFAKHKLCHQSLQRCWHRNHRYHELASRWEF